MSHKNKQNRALPKSVIDATKIIEDYRRFFASFWPEIFRISAKNLPLLSLRPLLTVGMTKIPKIPGLFHYFFAGISGIFPQNPRPKCLRLSLSKIQNDEIGSTSGHAQLAARLHARAHPTPRAHRGSRAPPPVELPRPRRKQQEPTSATTGTSAACVVRLACVRCVHARRGVRSGEARRLGVLRACTSLSIHVRPGAGEANEAQGPTTHITTRVRACGLTCVSRPDLRDVPRLARARPPCVTELTAQQRTWTGRDGGRGGAPSLPSCMDSSL